ncbi:hypothetical protein Plhal304r1_c002g0005601 [Plasmopara halstedii]
MHRHRRHGEFCSQWSSLPSTMRSMLNWVYLILHFVIRYFLFVSQGTRKNLVREGLGKRMPLNLLRLT